MAPSTGRQKKSSKNTESRGARDRVAKRAGNACIRCQRQKIKCSGAQPCEACTRRKLSCEFDRREQKVLVTRGYILDLEEKLARLERGESDKETTLGEFDISGNVSEAAESMYIDNGPSPTDRRPKTRESTNEQSVQNPESRPRLDPLASSLTNPLSSGQFMVGGDGKLYYLGTSSNWSFCRRVLNITHQHVHGVPVPTNSLLFDGFAYNLKWNGSRTTVAAEEPLLPNLDHAIYLVNTVTFHCGQFFHLFDEASFMQNLYNLYENPASRSPEPDLDYVHILLILAFGKAFSEKQHQAKRPPGADLFERALQLLPDVHILCREPIVSVEVLCCITLYLQCLDFRHSAHNYIGQAVRMAQGLGMQTDMPVEMLGEELVERFRRAWWTAYILDRELTSSMGLPQSTHEEDVCPKLPTFKGSNRRTSVLGMQIQLSQVIATINREVYCVDGRLNQRFLLSTKRVLASIAGLADELLEKFPLQLDQVINGISRTAGHLNLLYHQCIILATRPLLFCFLKIRFESAETYLDTLNSSQTVWNLIRMCVESAQQIVNILGCLKSQGLLETFLIFDLEFLFVSSVILLLGPVLDPQLLDKGALWVHTAYAIYDEMVASGNLLAEFRKSELQQLDNLLLSLNLDNAAIPADTIRSQLVGPLNSNAISQHMPSMSSFPMASRSAEDDAISSIVPGVMHDFSFDPGPTTAQIMDMANSIQSTDTDWLSNAILEHSIW